MFSLFYDTDCVIQVTIANLSNDGETATLWETYQVSRKTKKHTVLVGRWTSKTRPSNTNDGERIERCPAHVCDEERERNMSSQDLRALSVSKDVDTGVKSLTFGVLQAPIDDPHLRRQDLTGLHLTCTTIPVSLHL